MNQRKKHFEGYFVDGENLLLEQALLRSKAWFQGFLSGVFVGVFGMLLLTVIISRVWF